MANIKAIFKVWIFRNTYDKTIILYYEDGLHFQLVGYFQKDRMIKKFRREEIPTELLEIYNIDTNNF